MSHNLHELAPDDTVAMPSDRSTGLVFAAVALVIAWIWRSNPAALTLALAAAEILAVLAISFPRVLHPLNVTWFRLGLVLHKVVNPIVMLVLFAVVITPAGFIMQRLRDPLRLKKSPDASYWIDVDTPAVAQPGVSPGRPGPMTRQF